MTTTGLTGNPQFMYQNGFNTAAAYWCPGRPFLTGSALGSGEEQRIQFPTITKSVTVRAMGEQAIRVHFDTATGTDVISQGRFITLGSSSQTGPESYEFDVRTRDIYVSAIVATSYELCAICVQVDKNLMQPLSGTGINAN